MKIRTRAFLLGLLPTLLVAVVLTGYHVYSRLADLETADRAAGHGDGPPSGVFF